MTSTTLTPGSTPARHRTPPDPLAAPAVRTTGLTKAYRGRTVVDRLDLLLPSGVVSGFVGPNGAGKTTTIRMLLGLVRPTSGDGEVLGEPLGSPTRYLPSVGAMIEGPAFQPALSGRDNLALLARVGGLPVSRVAGVLERVGLAQRGSDPFRSYSLGMKQRLGIAAALLPQPRLLVLDEPTNGLDPAGIAQVRELITSFRDEGMTVLVSSHLLAEVEQVADHLVMIRQGALVFQGPVRDLVDAQRPELVAAAPSPREAALVAELAAGMGWPATVLDRTVRVELPGMLDDGEHAARATELNRRAHTLGVTLSRLDVVRPTLEQAFFELTGTASGDVR